MANKEKAEINLNYAIQELDKAADRLEVLSGKIDFLSKEYKNFTNRELTDKPDYSETIEIAKSFRQNQESPDNPESPESPENPENPESPENLI